MGNEISFPEIEVSTESISWPLARDATDSAGARLPTEILLQIMHLCDNLNTLLSLGMVNRRHYYILAAYKQELLPVIASRVLPDMQRMIRELVSNYKNMRPFRDRWVKKRDSVFYYNKYLRFTGQDWAKCKDPHSTYKTRDTHLEVKGRLHFVDRWTFSDGSERWVPLFYASHYLHNVSYDLETFNCYHTPKRPKGVLRRDMQGSDADHRWQPHTLAERLSIDDLTRNLTCVTSEWSGEELLPRAQRALHDFMTFTQDSSAKDQRYIAAVQTKRLSRLALFVFDEIELVRDHERGSSRQERARYTEQARKEIPIAVNAFQ